MSPSRYTRTGTRRAGDDYQDLVAVGLAIEMLSHPTRYAWMELEADGVGALDDVVLLSNDGRLVLRQIKFSTDADSENDPWTWEALLSKETEKSSSLLQKWSRGIQKALGKSAEFGAEAMDAAVVTNRRLHDEIASYLKAGYIEFGKLDEEIVRRATEQVGREQFEDFCKHLRWQTDWPNYDTLEKMHLRRFVELGGTNEGWLSLRSSIRDWVRLREEPQPSGCITVQHLRRAALWCPLESLPQNFEVPRDFVLPSEEFHEALMGKLLDKNTSFIVATGSPGVGKSTYLSYLTGVLQDEEMPVVRHHYWLSTEEDRRSRLEFEAVATSLMADLDKHYKQAVLPVAGQNPQATNLREWLETAATHFQGEGTRLVVIIDGLDHVWRELEHSAQELARLLDQVLFSHPGLVVVFGTQDLNSSALTPKLFRHAPRKEWLELPYLDTAAITRLLTHHAEELDLPGEEHARDHVLRQLAPALLDRSCGHPLHLRYCLKALKEDGTRITTEAVYALPECPRDIREYYRNLLDALEEEAALALQLIVEAPFPMAEGEIGDCLVAAGSELSAAQRGFRSIRHLLRGAGFGWSAFHGSVRQFVMEEPRFGLCQKRLREVILGWLCEQGDDERRWSHEWLLKAEWTDDEVPLREGPDREWAVRAIVQGRPLDQAQVILRESALASLRSQDIEGFVRTGLLAHYVSIPADFYHYERHRLMMPRLRLECNAELFGVLLMRMDDLNTEELLELIRYDHEFCQGVHAERIFEQMLALCDELRAPGVVRETAGWGEGVRSLLSACAYVEEGAEIALKLAQGSSEKPPAVILAEAGREFVRAGNFGALRQLHQGCPEQASHLLARYLIQGAIQEGVDVLDEFSDDGDVGIALFSIHANLRGLNASDGPLKFPSPRLFQKSNIDMMRMREAITEWFADFFWSCVACGMEGRPGLVDEFLVRCEAPPWTTQFLDALASSGKAAGQDIASRRVTTLDTLYGHFSQLPQRSWNPGDPDNEFHGTAPEVLTRISLELLQIQRAYSESRLISKSELMRSSDAILFVTDTWLDEYLRAGRLLLDEDAASWLVEHLGAQEDSHLAECEGRVAAYARLAGLDAWHDRLTEAGRFLESAAQNMLSHGWRKDVLFFNVLEVIESCRAADVGTAQEWLMRITPPILWVHDFTDGSETNALPERLAEALGKAAPDLLSGYYIWLTDQERYDNAQDVLHCMFECLDLNQTDIRALCRTAIDAGSVDVVRRLAANGRAGAAELQEELRVFMQDDGDENGAHEGGRDSSHAWETPVSPPSVSEYPPTKFTDYIAKVEALAGVHRGDCVREWAKHWGAGPTRAQTHEALLDNQESLGGLIPCREVYELVREYEGRKAAYPWLVRGYAEARGWSYFSLGKDDAMWYWQRLKEDFPGRWHEFLIRTYVESLWLPERYLHAHTTIPRIIEFLLFFGQEKLAAKATEAFVEASLEYVSALPLETPTWCIAAAEE